jgi:DNA-binding transcriptional MerR regulator
MKTITVLARQFGLSRSTLLYYDRIRLLAPSYRTHAEARLYSAADEARLRRIVSYREAGLTLATIRDLLTGAPGRARGALERRLFEVQRQIAGLRAQQRLVAAMLADAVVRGRGAAPTKAEWVAMLEACAFSPDDMRGWHVGLEREAPALHARFLKKLGLSPTEAERVRERSRGEWAAQRPAATSTSSARP